MEDTVSKELIIAWRESVSDAEKDRIIAEYGGKLRRRFTIVSADTVLFENSSKLNDLKREPLVKKLERNQQLHYLFRHNKSDRGAVSLEDDENSSSTSYYRENPYPSWKYINHFDAAQKMVVQKKDILVAVIADGIEIYEPSLQKHLWINEIEKEGSQA